MSLVIENSRGAVSTRVSMKSSASFNENVPTFAIYYTQLKLEMSFELSVSISINCKTLFSKIKEMANIPLANYDLMKRYDTNPSGDGGSRFVGYKGMGLIIACYYMDDSRHYSVADSNAITILGIRAGGKRVRSEASGGKWSIAISHYVPPVGYDRASWDRGRC